MTAPAVEPDPTSFRRSNPASIRSRWSPPATRPSCKKTNITVDSASTVGLNLQLKVGSASQTVTVSETPVQMDTQDASLGGVIDQRTVDSVPLLMNGSQRMITDFAWLFPPACQQKLKEPVARLHQHIQLRQYRHHQRLRAERHRF